MTSTLVDHHNFYSMTDYGNDLLIGPAYEIPKLDPQINK